MQDGIGAGSNEYVSNVSSNVTGNVTDQMAANVSMNVMAWRDMPNMVE